MANGQTFLMATVEKKQALPENIQKMIDELLADFLCQGELQDLSETLLSVTVAVATKNQQLKPDDVREKLKNHIKFVIQYWVLEKQEGVAGQVVDRAMVDLVRRIILGNLVLLGFSLKEIKEMFESGRNNGASVSKAVKEADAKVDRKVHQRRVAIAKMYEQQIKNALDGMGDMDEAFELGDKLVNALVELDDDQLADKDSVIGLLTTLIADNYRAKLNNTILGQ